MNDSVLTAPCPPLQHPPKDSFVIADSRSTNIRDGFYNRPNRFENRLQMLSQAKFITAPPALRRTPIREEPARLAWHAHVKQTGQHSVSQVVTLGWGMF